MAPDRAPREAGGGACSGDVVVLYARRGRQYSGDAARAAALAAACSPHIPVSVPVTASIKAVWLTPKARSIL